MSGLFEVRAVGLAAVGSCWRGGVECAVGCAARLLVVFDGLVFNVFKNRIIYYY